MPLCPPIRILLSILLASSAVTGLPSPVQQLERRNPLPSPAPAPAPVPAPVPANDIDSLLSRILTQIGHAIPVNTIPTSLAAKKKKPHRSHSTTTTAAAPSSTSTAHHVVIKNPKAVPNPKFYNPAKRAIPFGKADVPLVKRVEADIPILDDASKRVDGLEKQIERPKSEHELQRRNLLNPKAHTTAAKTPNTPPTTKTLGPVKVAKPTTALPNAKFTPTYIAKPVTGWPKITHPGEPHTKLTPTFIAKPVTGWPHVPHPGEPHPQQ